MCLGALCTVDSMKSRNVRNLFALFIDFLVNVLLVFALLCF